MSSTHRCPDIEIPSTDVWSTLFERTDRPFPDNQVLYINPTTKAQYTYRSLRQASLAIAAYLQARDAFGWQKGEVLALFLKNNIHTPAITWAAHYVGGVVSPANPAYTARELVHHLRDSGAKAVVTQRSLLATVVWACREAGIARSRVVLVEADDDDLSVSQDRTGRDGEEFVDFEELLRWKGEPATKVHVNPEKDLAFLVYSSGTTGLPKGVMLSHRNVVSNLCMVSSSEGTFLHWKRDRILSVLPYYHIYGLQCLVQLPAYTGLTTVVMPSFDLPTFCSLIQEYKITYTYVAPPVVLQLAKSPEVEKYDLSSLKTITSGAAPLTKELIFAVKKRLGTEVKQAYGLSETSPVTHMQKRWDDGPGSNGPALPNQTVRFMSASGVEVPAGEEGELWIRGPNVFLGYHRNAAATAAALTRDGFLRTGDVGRADAAGNMYITDRAKELIKYKGFPVAPAELEGLLAACPGVRDAAVLGLWDAVRQTEVPCACVVLEDGAEAGESPVRRLVQWVEERVAPHKRLRGGVRFVDEVPKSPSGKILRRLLREKIAAERKAEEGEKEEVKAKL